MQALQIRQANRESAALDQQISEVFTRVMPSEQPQYPRRQMQARLERIRKTAAGPQHFLRSLQAVSQAGADAPQLHIEAIGFREQVLDLKVTAPSVEAIAHLSQGISRQGLSAEIQSSAPLASGVEAHMQVKPASTRGSR